MMYCTNCGKYIPYDATVCNECAHASASQSGGWQNGAQNGAYQQGGGNAYESYYSFEPISPDIFDANQRGGFGTVPKSTNGSSAKKGLICAFAAAALAQLSAIFFSIFMEKTFGVMMIGILLTVLPAAVAAMVFSVKSIKCYRAMPEKGHILSVLTLIIGIYAAVNAGSAILLCLAYPLMFL